MVGVDLGKQKTDRRVVFAFLCSCFRTVLLMTFTVHVSLNALFTLRLSTVSIHVLHVCRYTAPPRIPTLHLQYTYSKVPASIDSSRSLVVGRAVDTNCDTANAVYTYLLPLYTKPDRQVPCLSLARSHAPTLRSQRTYHTYTHADTKIVARLSSQPCAPACLAAKCGVQLSMCLRGCRGTGRAPLLLLGRRRQKTAPSEWTRSRRGLQHAAAVPPHL